jgi:hypothetical protein
MLFSILFLKKMMSRKITPKMSMTVRIPIKSLFTFLAKKLIPYVVKLTATMRVIIKTKKDLSLDIVIGFDTS